MRILAALFCLLAPAAFAQPLPDAYLQMGDEYRGIFVVTTLATQQYYFPKKSSGSNALSTTPTGVSVRWLSITYATSSPVTSTFYIESPEFPAGVDTVTTNSSVRTYSIGGCPITSFTIVENGVFPDLEFYITVSD